MRTKEQIIKSSLKLFLQKGFYNVSLANIASDVGISKPAIYHHIQNKDSLVEGVLDYFTEKMSKWSLEYFNDVHSGEQFLYKMFSAIPIFKNVELILLEEVNEVFPNSYNDLLMTLSKYKPDFRKRIAIDINKTRDELRQQIANLQSQDEIKDQLDSDKIALLIQCIIEGSAFIAEIDTNLDLNAASEELLQLFWNLIKK